ncbi:MAG: ABC transporter substrate-binding protein [Sphaerochaeta sp.]|nr:ABC transporter substrate-binding protein [Sphaerochaeta sp.]
MRKRRLGFVLAMCLLIVVSLGAAGNVEPTAPAPQGPQLAPTFAGGWPYSIPPTGHFNMFVANAIELKFWREMHQLPLALYLNATGEYTPMLATDWNIDDASTAMTVNLRSDAKWLTGEKVTAKDVWTTFYVYRLVGNPAWTYISDVTVVSDTQVKFGIKSATPLFIRNVLRKPIVDTLTYGSYAEKTAELVKKGLDSTSQEWKNLVADFNSFRPTLVNSSGPYYIDPAKVSQASIEMPLNPNSFLADKVKFKTLTIYNGDVPDLTPLVLSGKIDYLTHVFPASSMQAFERAGYTFVQLPGVDGLAIYFNHALAPLGDVRVRQAIAHVIDRNRIGQLALPGVSVGVKYATGLGDSVTESWVDVSKLNTYPVDFAKAEALLKEAGLSKRNNVWYLANGRPFELALQCPSGWADASTAATEAAQQLTAFGIKTTFHGIESTQRTPNINSGKFELAMSFFGTGQPHPMYAYEGPLLASNTGAAGVGISFPMVQKTSLGEVNFNTLIQDSVKGWDVDQQKKIISKLAIAFSETLPVLPLYSKQARNLTSNGLRTIWEGPENLYLNSAGDDNFVVYQLLHGMIKAK